MSLVKRMPLAGQGEPLPREFPYVGQWILRDSIFLYLPKVPQSSGGPEMTLLLGSGPQWCFGINSMQLAFALGVGSEKIFEHNRNGTLFLVRTDDVPPTHGAIAAKRYVFRIGACQTEFIVKAGTSQLDSRGS